MGFRSEICNFFAVSLKLIQEHVSAMPKFAWKQHFILTKSSTGDELITDDAVKSALERVKGSMGADFDNIRSAKRRPRRAATMRVRCSRRYSLKSE